MFKKQNDEEITITMEKYKFENIIDILINSGRYIYATVLIRAVYQVDIHEAYAIMKANPAYKAD
jgi:hypothetical protein